MNTLSAGQVRPRSTRSTRLSGWAWWAALVAASLLYAIGLAVGPRLEQEAINVHTTETCLYRIDLPGPFGILLNCDSPTMVSNGVFPGQLREPGAYFQDRPGLPWLAWAMSQPISLLTDALGGRAGGEVQLPPGNTHSSAQALKLGAPVYAAYLLMHAALLLLTIALVRRSARACGLDADVAGLAAAPLLFNDMTKAFLLSPHQQIFNLFLPTLLACYLLQVFMQRTVSHRQAMALALLGGLGLLCYQGWLTVPFVLLIAAGWAWSLGGAARLAARAVAWRYPLMMLAMFLPYAAWYGYVVQRNGTFNIPLVSEGKVGSWVMDSLQHAPLQLPGRVALKVGGLVQLALAHALPFALSALGALAAGWAWRRQIPPALWRLLRLAAVAALLTSAVFIFVFMMSSWTIWRYGFTMLPALALPTALLWAAVHQALPAPGARRALVAGLALLALGCAVYAVVKQGPWC